MYLNAIHRLEDAEAFRGQFEHPKRRRSVAVGHHERGVCASTRLLEGESLRATRARVNDSPLTRDQRESVVCVPDDEHVGAGLAEQPSAQSRSDVLGSNVKPRPAPS
jgi:hypothetical protein